ncbi:MAG TPA: rhamnogalacturonan acetylesterase [Pyrinomonadaceae bacterium]
MKVKPHLTWIIFSMSVVAAQAQSHMRFEFGTGTASPGRVAVRSTDIYRKEKGYGFEPSAGVTCSAVGGKTAAGFCSSDRPFYFSAAVPEGNYKVTITFGNKIDASVTTVKAELRRLMLERIETRKGKFATASFIVNVRTPAISADGEVKLKDREKTTEWWEWDEKLTLEFNNSRPSIDSIDIEPVNVPTIFLLGDSTVCDQPLEPYASWGQMLTRFFGGGVAIANHAESGESLRSSLGAKRLDKVLSLIKPGDYLLIQYAHNDEKEKGPGVGAFTTFKSDLKFFVESARKKGAYPVLIPPVQRRTFDANGKITNSHGDYPEAVRQAAREENVPLIDLNAMSKVLYETLGKDGSGILFKQGDGTHHDNYGAYELAKCIVEGIKTNELDIAKYLAKGVPAFDPAHPDPIDKFDVPASPISTDVKPPGN